jgi:hypothetical protein
LDSAHKDWPTAAVVDPMRDNVHVLETGGRHDPKFDVEIRRAPDATAQVMENPRVLGMDGALHSVHAAPWRRRHIEDAIHLLGPDAVLRDVPGKAASPTRR